MKRPSARRAAKGSDESLENKDTTSTVDKENPRKRPAAKGLEKTVTKKEPAMKKPATKKTEVKQNEKGGDQEMAAPLQPLEEAEEEVRDEDEIVEPGDSEGLPGGSKSHSIMKKPAAAPKVPPSNSQKLISTEECANGWVVQKFARGGQTNRGYPYFKYFKAGVGSFYSLKQAKQHGFSP